MNKKIITSVLKKLFLFLLLINPSIIYAKQYNISDYKMKVEIADGWDVFTRDNIYDNDKLAQYNISYEYLNNLMINNSIYIDAVHQSGLELFIRVKSDIKLINNLSNLSASDLKEFASGLLERTNAKDYSIIRNNGLTFIKYYYYDNNAEFYILEYDTIVNTNVIAISVQHQEKNAITLLEKEIEQIVNTTTIETDPTKANEDSKSKAYHLGEEVGEILGKAIVGGIVGTIVLIFYNIRKKKIMIKNKQNMDVTK